MKVYIIHENDEWQAPLGAALDGQGVPYEYWHLGQGHRALSAPPPAGVFYNRMSASSHSRGHRAAPELAAALLEWLVAAGRRVINGPRAVDLEISKARQYTAFQRAGIEVPEWRAALDDDGLRAAAEAVGFPVIVKPNRGGKGLGVQQFSSGSALDQALRAGWIDRGPDQLGIVQRYVASPDRAIVRCEFVGGALVYAVRVDASGGFELCPADGCDTGPAGTPEPEPSCPADGGAQFRVLDGFDHPNLARYRAFLAENGLEVAGIEMLHDGQGRAWTYDLNTNTNYNPGAERAAGLSDGPGSGMGALARFLGRELRRAQGAAAAAA